MTKHRCKFSHTWSPEVGNCSPPVHVCGAVHQRTTFCPLQCPAYVPLLELNEQGVRKLLLKVIETAMDIAREDKSILAANAALHWSVVYGEDPYSAAEHIAQAMGIR